MDLFIKIGVEDEASDRISKITKTVGGGLANAAKLGGAAVAAAATVVGKFAKDAVDAYGNYEQLVGGVETLFGAGGRTIEEFAERTGLAGDAALKAYGDLMTAQDTVMRNASNAYKTAGLSANQYMETVTSFSAALIADLEGDTRAAARISDMAITDMADNANKMGTDMSALQSAYQGFAKQNYTMLDNLKLGYGGTKTEMERLLADAQKISGVKYDINNLADVYEAIHVIQTELDITGTTAREAATTIQGSWGMLSGAWQNLITGLGDPNADLDALFGNVIEAGETFLGNLMPILERALVGIGDVIEKAGPLIAERIPELIPQIVPGLLSAAVAIVSALIASLPELIGTIIAVLPGLMEQIWDALKKTAAKAAEVGKAIVDSILAGLRSAWDSLAQWVSSKLQSLLSGLSNIGEMLGNAAISMQGYHANGLDYVPYNGYPAVLHKGEAVLTATEADTWRQGGGSEGGKVVNLNIYAQQLSQADMDYIVATVNRELAP